MTGIDEALLKIYLIDWSLNVLWFI